MKKTKKTRKNEIFIFQKSFEILKIKRRKIFKNYCTLEIGTITLNVVFYSPSQMNV